MSNLNFVDQVYNVSNRIESLEELAGKGLMMPNNAANSGSRKIMYSTQIEHVLQLMNPEPALLQTGYENRFGENSSAFIKAKADYEVVAKINKFSANPDHNYYLIIQHKETGEYDVIHRVSYKHITESYGYLYNNKYIDTKEVGSKIFKDDTVIKSMSFDAADNRQDGTNLYTTYISCEYTKEDGIILSKTGAKKLASPLIKVVQVVINDNDIPLNIYGNNDLYKSFPNINEDIKDGILCVLRREKKEEALFSQSVNRLQEILLSDDPSSVQGKVIDINVYCNNTEALETSHHSAQIKYYHDEHMACIRQFVAIVNSLKLKGGKLSYDLQKLYYNFKKILEGGQYLKDKPFSNTIIEFTVFEESEVQVGDKISNRHGGKGVVSLILDDELMPQLENGEYVEAIFNSSTCVNRENPGQLFESSATHVGSKLIDYIRLGVLDFDQSLELYFDYLRVIVPEQAQEIYGYVQELSTEDKIGFLTSVISDNGINVSMRPLSESMSIDKLAQLYDKFPYVGLYKVKVPQMSSNGTLRYIETRRELVVGKQYIYRLKQYAEEKFSAVSLSATNLKNENSRNPSKRSYKSIHAKTPVRFGGMETGDLIHLGAENVIINLMLHSASPHGRRLAEDLLTGDPFNIDIKLDDMSTNRSVEILNAYLLTMGLELQFEKKPKRYQKAFRNRIITQLANPANDGLKTILWQCNPNEKIDPDYLEKFKELDNQPFKYNIIRYVR